jgi:hypothetical protein
MPDRSETVRLLNRSARVRFYLGQSSCLGCRAELAADRIYAVPRTNWVQLHWKRGIRGGPPLRIGIAAARGVLTEAVYRPAKRRALRRSAGHPG